MNTQSVYIVDDDAAVRDALTLLLEQEAIEVQAYASAEDFLATNLEAATGCAIVDIRMAGMDGMQLQAELARREIRLPIIFLTGHGNIPMSVRAIKSGAVDFLTKPITAETLLASVRAAMLENEKKLALLAEGQTALNRINALTERERDVMQLAVEGLCNKDIARRLEISHRTVEIHKARVMHKTGTNSVLELAKLLKALPTA
jgi:FixJ family two-component response regulator